MCLKMFRGIILFILLGVILSFGACSNRSLGQIVWSYNVEAEDEKGKADDDYVTDWFREDEIFYVGENDIKELNLDAKLKTDEHGIVSIKITNNSKNNKIEWEDVFNGGDISFSIILSNLKAGDLYLIDLEAKNIKRIDFGITPSGDIEFVKDNTLNIYKAVKK